MFKVQIVCDKCEKESAAYDDSNGLLIIDFKKKQFVFHCPFCGHMNIMDFTTITEALSQRMKLPRISVSKY